MSNTVKSPVAIRDIRSERTRIYIAQLLRKDGASAQDLKDAVIASGMIRRAEGFTSHNSYSLQLLANTYGYAFIAIDYTDNVRRYFFRSEKNASTFDAFKTEQARDLAKRTREAEKAERDAQAERDAAKAQREARKAAKAPSVSVASVASKAPRKAPSNARKAPIAVIVADVSNETVKGARA